MDRKLCWVCHQKACLQCPQSGCHLFSCSPSHLRLHQSKEACRPLQLRQDSRVGRYLVASRNIKKGELLLVEEPLVVGPSREKKLVCVECLVPMSKPEICPSCPLPLCPSCVGGHWHSIECQIYRGRELFANPERILPHLEILTALRLVLVRRRALSSDDQPPLTLCQAGEDSEGAILEADLVGRVLSFLGREEDEEEVVSAYRQLFLNSKALIEGGQAGSGVFPLFSLINHSCAPNTITMVGSDRKLQLRAVEDIRIGEEVTTRYGGLNIGQPRRSQLLLDHWGFVCTCKRCRDPTEFNTFNSGVVCPSSDCPGFLLPSRALLWSCNVCQNQVPLEFIFKTLRDADIFIKNNIGPGEVEEGLLERAILHLAHSLHPHHFLLSQVNLVLLTKYSLLPSPARPILERITQLGQELVHLTSCLDSPLSPALPRILKVLIPAWSRLTEADSAMGRISVQQVKLRQALCYRYVDQLVASSRLWRQTTK